MMIGASAAPSSRRAAGSLELRATAAWVADGLVPGRLGVALNLSGGPLIGSAANCGSGGEDGRSHIGGGGGGTKPGRCGDPAGDEDSSTRRGFFRCVEESSPDGCRFSIRWRFLVDDTGCRRSRGGNSSSSEILVASVWSALVGWLLVRAFWPGGEVLGKEGVSANSSSSSSSNRMGPLSCSSAGAATSPVAC